MTAVSDSLSASRPASLTGYVDGEKLRVLALHAHPDDETLYTGGTLAAYQAAGAQTAVLTCTLGEKGEVIGETYAQLVAAGGGADQLGGYRIHELTQALQALHAGCPHFLGGAGHFRDSGMLNTPANDHPRAFLRADPDHVADLIACWIRWMRPHVVLVYDDGGTYGHPDHIRAHHCGLLAVDKAAYTGDRSIEQLHEAGLYADPLWQAEHRCGYGGTHLYHAEEPLEKEPLAPAWDVPLVYWMMQSMSRVEAGLNTIAGAIPSQWSMPAAHDIFNTADNEATHTIALDDAAYAAKIAALRAHATQVTVYAPTSGPVSFAMSNNIAQPLLRTEEYRLVRHPHSASAVNSADIAAALAHTRLSE